MISRIFVLAGLICTLSSCTPDSPSSEDQLGIVEFDVTGKSEAQPFFKKGLLLLHSFEYTDAAEAFRKAKELDPGFVMAYWGEALTHNHSLWRYPWAILRSLQHFQA